MAEISLFDLQQRLVSSMMSGPISSELMGQPPTLQRNVFNQDAAEFIRNVVKPGGNPTDRIDVSALADRLDGLARDQFVGRQSSVNIHSYLRDIAQDLRRSAVSPEAQRREAPPETRIKTDAVARELRQNIDVGVYNGQERERAVKLAEQLEKAGSVTRTEFDGIINQNDLDGRARTFAQQRLSEYDSAAKYNLSVTPHDPHVERQKFEPSYRGPSDTPKSSIPLEAEAPRTGFFKNVLGRLGLAGAVLAAVVTGATAYSNGASAAEAAGDGISAGSDVGRVAVSTLKGDFRTASGQALDATLTNGAALGVGALTVAVGGGLSAGLVLPGVAAYTVSRGIEEVRRGGLTGDQARQMQTQLVADAVASGQLPDKVTYAGKEMGIQEALEDRSARRGLARMAARSNDEQTVRLIADYGILEAISNSDPAKPEPTAIAAAPAPVQQTQLNMRPGGMG